MKKLLLGKILLAICGVILLAASCGGASESPQTQTQTGQSIASPFVFGTGIESSRLPSVEVFSVPDGNTLNLRAVEDGERPTLIWFWAPH